jgi:hypothetical protein
LFKMSLLQSANDIAVGVYIESTEMHLFKRNLESISDSGWRDYRSESTKL